MPEGFMSVPIGARTAGVYVLRNRGRVMHVGATKNLLTRIYAHAQHHRGKPLLAGMPQRPVPYDEVQVRPCRPDLLDSALATARAELNWSPAA